MRKIVVSVLLLVVTLSGRSETRAQTALPKDDSCQPSAEEILSVIKSVYNLSPIPEGVLLAGEVRVGGVNHLPRESESRSLFRLLAMFGGVLKTAKQPLYLIRRSSEDGTRIKLEIDIRDIKQGRAKDVVIEKGDVVFVARGCADGNLLPPTKPEFPSVKPPGTDTPTNTPNKRDTR